MDSQRLVGRWLRRRLAGVCLVVLLLALALAGATRGAPTITVNTTNDAAATPAECSGAANDCSLRQAIDKAAVGDTISVPANASPYAVTLGEIAFSTDNLTIQGAGARQTTVQGNGSSRIFNIGGTTEKIAGVTISGGGGVDPGAGIETSAGTLTLDAVTVRDNAATGVNGTGGGIFASGNLTITNSTIGPNNTATGTGSSPHQAGGGGIEITRATLTLTDTTGRDKPVTGAHSPFR